MSGTFRQYSGSFRKVSGRFPEADTNVCHRKVPEGFRKVPEGFVKRFSRRDTDTSVSPRFERSVSGTLFSRLEACVPEGFRKDTGRTPEDKSSVKGKCPSGLAMAITVDYLWRRPEAKH